MLEDFKESLQTSFYMTDLWVMKYFLDIEIHQSSNDIFVGQQNYSIDIIQNLKMIN